MSASYRDDYLRIVPGLNGQDADATEGSVYIDASLSYAHQRQLPVFVRGAEPRPIRTSTCTTTRPRSGTSTSGTSVGSTRWECGSVTDEWVGGAIGAPPESKRALGPYIRM